MKKWKCKCLAAITAMMLSVGMTGCGEAATVTSSTQSSSSAKENTASSTTDATTGDYSDTLVVDLVAEPVSMDPGHVTDINSMRVHDLMYDKLIEWGDDGFTLEPCIATDWKMTKEDGTEYVFQIRQGVKFHDGSELTAEDVEFTFMRMLDENHECYGTGPFPNASSFFGMVEKVEATGEYEVTFTLNETNAAFLQFLTNDCGSIVNADVIRNAGSEGTSLLDAGCGPYKLESWEKGVSVKLSAFDDYWGDKALTPNVIIEPVIEPLVRVTKLLNGETDIVTDVDPDSVAQVEASGYEVQQVLGPHFWYVVLNCSAKPFDDVRVRQAVNYAIDKETICNDLLKGTGTPATQPLTPSENGYNSDITGYEYNPEKAKELLAEAGYPDGFEVNYLIPESGSGMQSCVAMSTAIQGYLADVGITANIEKMEWGTFLNRCMSEDLIGDEAEYQMWSLSWMNVAGDPDSILAKLFSNDNMIFYNCGFYDSDEVSDLLADAIVELDAQKRTSMYKEISAKIVEDAPVIFVDWGNQIAGVSPSVNGFTLHPDQMLRLEKVTKNK